MTTEEGVLFTGAKPTGDFHIGNYFGFIKPAIEAIAKYPKSYLFIADLHALTSSIDPKDLNENIFRTAATYVAAGLDPAKTILFKQSDVPAHTELAWIFECITTMPYLMRAHAYKDAEAKNKEINAGVFNYPMLMAADILLYNSTLIPVGQDQKQHVEYARDIAEKFNRLYGETFKIPSEKITEGVGVILGTDGQKMSKSYKNTIPLFGTKEEIATAVMGIVTDSKSAVEPKDPETCNIFAIHKLVDGEENLEKLKEKYKNGTISYKESKELLIEKIEKVFAPMREKYLSLMEDKDKLRKIIKSGGEKANEVAAEKLFDVRKKIGLEI